MHITLRAKSVVIGLVAIAIAAVLLDRIALYVWSASVLRQFQRYRLSAGPQQRRQPAPSLAATTEPPLWTKELVASEPPHLNPNVLIALEPAIARPNFVSIKGYVVSLMYFPPALAWSTRLFPSRPRSLPYAYYRPQDHYGYQIDADFTPSYTPPTFRLYRLVTFERRELPPDTHVPELFP